MADAVQEGRETAARLFADELWARGAVFGARADYLLARRRHGVGAVSRGQLNAARRHYRRLRAEYDRLHAAAAEGA
jgi:hypothetical protein